MNQNKIIVFDLDDTLYLERDFVRSGFYVVAKHLEKIQLVHHNTFFNTAWDLFEKGVRNTIFNQALKILEIECSQERIIELVDIYRYHSPVIKPFENTDYLLKNLICRGVILGMISDGPYQSQKNKLMGLGLELYFRHIIFTGFYGPDWNKPSPQAFIEIMKKTHSKPENYTYIADNPRKDFIAPNLLGWNTIRLRYTLGQYYLEVPPVGGEPDICLDSFQELCNFLLQDNV